MKFGQPKSPEKLKSQAEKTRERKPTIKFENISTANLTEKDFDTIRKLEAEVYKNTELTQGMELIEDIKSGNGLEYSLIISGKNSKQKKAEAIGYIVAVESKTDEGDPSIYMEDIAVLNEAQGQGLGWELLKELVNKLKSKAQKDGKPVLFDMHLRESSQQLLQKHKEGKEGLKSMGVSLIEEAYVLDYYYEGEDALYQIYEVK
jgi:ribosomal protein S18 acetylase RimI-like enzyme